MQTSTANLLRRCTLAAILASASVLATASDAMGPAPAFTLTDLSGASRALSQYKGQVVMVNFWATWCGPCKEEMPMLVAVEKEWAAKGIVFIGASLDDRKTQKNIPAFVQKFAIDFPVWQGATSEDLDRLEMGEAVPDTAFIAEDGTILFRVQGEIKKAELIERLEWLSSDRKSPAPKARLRNL